MKVTIKQYAQGLYEVVSKAEDGDFKVVLKNFVKILAMRNELRKIDKIMEEFGNLWNKERGIVEGELVSARKLSAEVVMLLHEQVVILLKAKEAKLEQSVDKDILGGFVVRLDDAVIDGSLKTQLVNLKNKLAI